MKAISLWQPWATLVAIQAKRYETRSWGTTYRGSIAIHAAKKWNRDLCQIALGPFFIDILETLYPNPGMMPFGAIVAVANLVDIELTENIRSTLSLQERNFGDYSTGRYAWKLDNIRAVGPIYCRGQQGLWDLDRDIRIAIQSR